jgi:hypothetical protein
MIEAAESLKKLAEKAARAAQEKMSDQPPLPIELGGAVDKLPRPGLVISPPPLPKLPV